MLRASALYIVIVIALVIAVLCSALIISAYYYKLQYQKKFRYDRLQSNLTSGINILLASDTITYKSEKQFGLFEIGEDSVSLKKANWGLYEMNTCLAFIQKDTLKKAFMSANSIDSSKWAALYLIDEDRPLSLSGQTMIRGDAFVPKAGVKEAYVDGKAYQGDKRLIIGNKHDSERSLPALQEGKLRRIEALKSYKYADSSFHNRDSIGNSFFKPTVVINFKKRITTLENIKLNGNILILSDTIITIANTANLNNVIIYAEAIRVEDGFKGRCQLFASDSIGVQNTCNFVYPSSLGLLRFKPNKGLQGRIGIGNNTTINGTVFTYEKEKSQLKNIIDIGKNVLLYGQVYSQGLVRFQDGIKLNGSIFTNRFLFQSSYTMFENYLINAQIDSKNLSPYYLSSSLLPVVISQQKVLQWLESN